jgi:hypothetical protein
MAPVSRLVRRIVQEIAVDSPPKEITRMAWIWKGNPGSLTAEEKRALENQLFQAIQTYLYKIAAKELFKKPSLKHKIEP